MRASHYLLLMHLGTEILALLRNVILARLLGPAEMGTAAVFAIGLRFLEMGSDCAADRLLIQADDGDEPRMQAAAHGIEILRGAVSGAIFSACLLAIGLLVSDSSSPFDFLVLALVPISRGFVHLDYKRLQRNLHFRPASVIELTSAMSAVAVAAPLALWLGDYRAVLVVAAMQGMTLVVASHLLAERRYQVTFAEELLRRFFHFGWPLAVNGMLMFGVFQGDRLVIALCCTPAELGCYSVCFSLSLIPVLILSRLFNSVFLPTLSRCKSNENQLQRYFQAGNLLVSSAAVWLGLGIAVLGASAVRLLYGSEFLLSDGVFALLGLMQATRLFRSLASVASVALGDSQQPLIVNLFRLSGLVVGVSVALLGWGLFAIAAASFMGELLAAGAAMLILRTRCRIPLADWKLPAAQFAAMIALVGLLGLSFESQFRNLALMLAVMSLGILQAVCVLQCWKLLNLPAATELRTETKVALGALE